MDRRLYEKDDTEAGMRAATRLGGHEPAIAKARIAMLGKGGDKKLVEAVPAAAHNDIGYKFASIQMLRRADKAAEAAALMATIPQLDDSHDLDEWWIERRLLVRKLLDEDDPKTGLHRRPRRHAADTGQLPRRTPVHRGLDRAALPERSDHRRRALQEGHRRRREPDCAGARPLLAGPRRGGAEEAPGGPHALPGGGALPDRLLRPDRPRQGRTGRYCSQLTACPLRRRAGRAGEVRGGARRGTALRRRRPRPAQRGDGGPRRQVERHRRRW